MKSKFSFFSIFVAIFQMNFAQVLVGSNELQVALQDNGNGYELSDITHNGESILESHSYLFYLYLTDINTGTETRISATTGWGQVDITNDPSHCHLHFSQPDNVNLPAGLNVDFDLNVDNGVSSWHLAVNGVGDNHTLTRVNFPKFKLKIQANDHFFVPKFSGLMFPNPLAENINFDLTYPRGRLGASMPFAAYINAINSVYLGFHDPTASLKNLVIQAENNYVKYYGKHNIPNKTLPDNDWTMPGTFELRVYDGQWYEAAMIYKDWAQNNAPYYPQSSADRDYRLHQIGDIAVWAHVQPPLSHPVSATMNEIDLFKALFPNNLPIGFHWYKWNNLPQDDDYPHYFPERTGFDQAVQDVQQAGHAVMPYINGMLYDVDLNDYAANGFPYATKHADGQAYVYTYAADPAEPNQQAQSFAVMCPTQTPWQNNLSNTFGELTNRLQAKAIYVDMVAWAGATECMDTTHNHPLASGHWWHDGYVSMLNQMHDQNPHTFITVEGATDNFADVVDGFLIGEWRINNLVPAFQAIYGGKNQFFGMTYGVSHYNDASFYTKFANAFVNDIQPGRFFLYFAQDPDTEDYARDFVVDLAIMRYKLKNFMSYGQMLKPFDINGNIPDITSDWGPEDVTVSAIQKNSYINTTQDTIAFVFSNASMTDAYDFEFMPDVAENSGIEGDYDVQLITADNDQAPVTVSAGTVVQVHLEPMKSIAYLVTHHNTVEVSSLEKSQLQIYPNPVENILNIALTNNDRIIQIQVTDLAGKLIYQLKNKQQINVSGLKKGIYIIKLTTDKAVYQTKFTKN